MFNTIEPTSSSLSADCLQQYSLVVFFILFVFFLIFFLSLNEEFNPLIK